MATSTDNPTSTNNPEPDIDDLDHQDSELIRLLACGVSQSKAAAQLGISTRTIRRRKEDPVFRSRLSEAKRELHAQSWSMMMDLREKAARALDEALDSDDERTRLAAARYVFDMGARIRRDQVSEETLERVEALEAKLTPSAEV